MSTENASTGVANIRKLIQRTVVEELTNML